MTNKTLEHRALENAYILISTQMEWIEDAINGKPLSEFALSFPLIRRIYDLKKSHTDLEMEKLPKPKSSFPIEENGV